MSIRRRTPLRCSMKPIPRRSRIRRGRAPNRARRTTLAAEKRGLWREFAAYVKARDGAVCFTCDTRATGVSLHAGHLFTRSRQSTLYDFRNVHSQCAGCNRGRRGNVPEYVARFVAKYGQTEFEALTQRARQMKQWTLPEVQALRAALKRGPAEFECLYAERYMIPKRRHVDHGTS